VCVCVCVCPQRGDAHSALSSTQVLNEDRSPFLAFGAPCSRGRCVGEDSISHGHIEYDSRGGWLVLKSKIWFLARTCSIFLTFSAPLYGHKRGNNAVWIQRYKAQDRVAHHALGGSQVYNICVCLFVCVSACVFVCVCISIEALTTREVALGSIHMIFMCVCEYTFIML
jgi:hypothetical protein